MHQLLESPHQGSPLFLHKPVGCGHTQLPLAKCSCVISACVIELFSRVASPCCAGPQHCSTASMAMPPTCLHSCKAHSSTWWPVHPPRPGMLTFLSLVVSCNAAITPTHACVQVWFGAACALSVVHTFVCHKPSSSKLAASATAFPVKVHLLPHISVVSSSSCNLRTAPHKHA